MLVFGDGPIALRFGYSALERSARRMSLAGLLLVAAVAFAERARRRGARTTHLSSPEGG